MPEYYIEFHGHAWVDADSEEEARTAFYDDFEDVSEYVIDAVEEA